MEMLTLTLKTFEEVADGTRMFTFSRPDGFSFRAGQYVALRIDAARLVEPDVRGGVRSFSIASAPYEEDLAFVMRAGITGFKKTMWDLKEGDTIFSTPAVGHCTVPENDGKAIVLLAGGVGIAPARAMIREAVEQVDTRGYYLFYSNRELKDAAFHEDMLSVGLKNFHYIYTLTSAASEPTEPGEERGYITADMIGKHLPDMAKAHYYVIGAPAFAEAMEKMLLDAGVEKAEIKIDPFTGLTGPAPVNK
jgi:ferredoxin-NADP reductase